jgi:hypothetical protein
MVCKKGGTVTKQQISTVNNLFSNYVWKRGSWQLAILKTLMKYENRSLDPKQLKMLHIIQAQAAIQDRSRVQAQARSRLNEKRYNRQLGVVR